jgi:hypothetical protein
MTCTRLRMSDFDCARMFGSVGFAAAMLIDPVMLALAESSTEACCCSFSYEEMDVKED